ncbi:DNA mismatch repair protein muts2, partial [Striga asiatica]
PPWASWRHVQHASRWAEVRARHAISWTRPPRPLDFSGIEDVSPIVDAAVSGEMLSIGELCSVSKMLRTARSLIERYHLRVIHKRAPPWASWRHVQHASRWAEVRARHAISWTRPPRPLDFSGIEDVSPIVDAAVSGEMLSIGELCSVSETLRSARSLIEQLKENEALILETTSYGIAAKSGHAAGGGG